MVGNYREDILVLETPKEYKYLKWFNPKWSLIAFLSDGLIVWCPNRRIKKD